MRRAWVVLFAGLLIAAAAYFGIYYAGTAASRRLEQSETPELAWLKAEFHLGDAEFQRVCQVHEGYLAGCAERCRRIDEKNADLKRLLADAKTITPEIEKTLNEAAQLRAACQKQMLQHFYEVSQTMPPEQGLRYLAWVQQRTVLADTHSQMTGKAQPMEPHAHH
jgi:hypothetical protein